MKKQVELSITHNGKDVVAYPYTKKEHVQFENGMNIDEFVGQDIATPTITHDTTAIKVGVGDSDVSSSVVDSAVNMTIKGQTYQNILPEPTLRNEMQGKSMQRLNEGYDSIETVDGVSKSAILKGQTLVNVDSYYSTDDFSMHNIDTISSDGYIKLTANGTWRNSFTKFNGMLKPNTKYLAIVDIKTNTLADGTRPFRMFTNGTNSEGTVVNVPFVDQEKDIECGVIGTFKYILTTRGDLSTITTTSRNFISNTVTSGVIEYRYVLIEYQDGMENWDIPFFRGIQSVKMPVLTTTGKNLLDVGGLKQENAYIDNTDGNIKSSNGHIAFLDYIAIPNSGNILFFNNSAYSGAYLKLAFYDINKIYISGVTLNTGDIKASIPNNAKYCRVSAFNHSNGFDLQLEVSDSKTSYEPYKTNILRTPEEVVLRSLPNGVTDTLNIDTGEYVQRIGEMKITDEMIDKFTIYNNFINNFNSIFNGLPERKIETFANTSSISMLSDKMIANIWNGGTMAENVVCFSQYNNGTMRAYHYPNWTLDEFKEWFRENKPTIQYELATPIIKTVDLSSHGNWEKVVLDGSDSITYGANWNETGTAYYTNLYFDHPHVFSDRMTKTGGWSITEPDHSFALRENNKKYQLVLVVYNQHTNGAHNVQGLKQYLSQNPITFWYQTTTTQDNSIREMLSFANGHLQVSSEAENSLLPSVQYEIPTKNSYHMDLMKVNTLYTMKAKSVSGTFTIDGTSYNVNANGTFTSPSSMTDKLLVMSNKTNKEVMLLEGNVVDKTIPYFKGIKSAFEGEEEIEIVSTGKNLLDDTPFKNVKITNGSSGTTVTIPFKMTKDTVYFKVLDVKGNPINDENIAIGFKKGETQLDIRGTHANSKTMSNYQEVDGVRIYWNNIAPTTEIGSVIFALSEDDITNYEPYKSNVSKIPLLSPLRSLPNGVCDELVIDRLNHKAKLIQRIAYETYVGEESWNCYNENANKKVEGWYLANKGVVDVGANENLFSQPLRPNGNSIHHRSEEGVGTSSTSSNVRVCLNRDKLYPLGYSATGGDKVGIFKQWLSQNPLTVLYELNTPIITEIDLEGYPYAYKDGHIFLNSEIAPTTQITYSINQAQQIESANENLQRHEKEISRLQKLIAQYIQVEYESTLLSLKI